MRYETELPSGARLTIDIDKHDARDMPAAADWLGGVERIVAAQAALVEAQAAFAEGTVQPPAPAPSPAEPADLTVRGTPRKLAKPSAADKSPKRCAYCGRLFTPEQRSDQKYCVPRCGRRADYARKHPGFRQCYADDCRAKYEPSHAGHFYCKDACGQRARAAGETLRERRPHAPAPVEEPKPAPAHRKPAPVTEGRSAQQRVIDTLRDYGEPMTPAGCAVLAGTSTWTVHNTARNCDQVVRVKRGQVAHVSCAHKPARKTVAPAAPAEPVQQELPLGQAPADQADDGELTPAPVKQTTVAVLLGGRAKLYQSTRKKVATEFGYDVQHHVTDSRDYTRDIPANADLVILMTDQNSAQGRSYADRAKAAGLFVVRSNSRWSCLAQAIREQYTQRVNGARHA